MSDSVLTTAMTVVLTWGPERMIPEEERIRKVHPGLSDEDVQKARSTAYNVITEATNYIAPATKRGSLSRPAAIQQLQKGRPWLTHEQASQAINQGEYYHWRETGD